MATFHFEPGRPESSEYLAYFDTYISLVPETEIGSVLSEQAQQLRDLLSPIDEDEANKLHAPYTWSLKQVIGHCNDTERIFAYRACCFASGEQQSLPGFDQDAYVAEVDYTALSMDQLLNEFESLRLSSLWMFQRFSDSAWARSGTADGKLLSVRAAAYIMAGHIRHHLRIMESRLA